MGGERRFQQGRLLGLEGTRRLRLCQHRRGQPRRHRPRQRGDLLTGSCPRTVHAGRRQPDQHHRQLHPGVGQRPVGPDQGRRAAGAGRRHRTAHRRPNARQGRHQRLDRGRDHRRRHDRHLHHLRLPSPRLDGHDRAQHLCPHRLRTARMAGRHAYAPRPRRIRPRDRVGDRRQRARLRASARRICRPTRSRHRHGTQHRFQQSVVGDHRLQCHDPSRRSVAVLPGFGTGQGLRRHALDRCHRVDGVGPRRRTGPHRMAGPQIIRPQPAGPLGAGRQGPHTSMVERKRTQSHAPKRIVDRHHGGRCSRLHRRHRRTRTQPRRGVHRWSTPRVLDGEGARRRGRPSGRQRCGIPHGSRAGLIG